MKTTLRFITYGVAVYQYNEDDFFILVLIVKKAFLELQV